jgi:hypothetical protein
VDVVHVRKPLGEEVMGWIAACVLIALLLPIMGILYLDILETKNEAKSQLEKVEKLRRQVEQKDRKPPICTASGTCPEQLVTIEKEKK